MSFPASEYAFSGAIDYWRMATCPIGDAAMDLQDVMLPEVDPLDYTEGEIITAGSSTVFPLSERMAELWTDAGGVAPVDRFHRLRRWF